MEQQKVLIIIISAALFIAAVLGVGLALFYPDAGGETAASAREFDPIEYARPEREAPDEERVIVFGESDEVEGEEAEGEEAEGEQRVILLTEEEPQAPEEREPEQSGVTSRPARGEEPREREAAEPAASRQSAPAREPAAPARQTTAAYQAAPQPEPRRIRVTEHWIQLISSPNRERVDLVRERLREEYSLGGRVTSREVEGTTYYRLRLGPYDDRAEAEKFLTWVRDIEGFSGAYISEEYPLRTVR